jgi:hypothetical protein
MAKISETDANSFAQSTRPHSSQFPYYRITVHVAMQSVTSCWQPESSGKYTFLYYEDLFLP